MHFILLQLCFYAPNRAADRTVAVQPKTGTDSDQRLRAHGSDQIHGHLFVQFAQLRHHPDEDLGPLSVFSDNML